jgi:hypothetical protein
LAVLLPLDEEERMGERNAVRRLGLVLALAVVFAAAQGCTYLKYRGQDFMEMADLGLTITKTPQIGLYANGVSIVCGGYSNIDGWFAGWGGGKFGVQRHYNYCWGMLLGGWEEIGWGDFDKNDPDTLYRQQQGIIGIVQPPYDSNPAYVPACVHYLHLGWLGVVGNLRYMEMIDFLAGWATLDLSGDDGYEFGAWPGRRRGQL